MSERPLPEPVERYLESKRLERGLCRSTLQEYRRDLEDFGRWLAKGASGHAGGIALTLYSRNRSERYRRRDLRDLCRWLAGRHRKPVDKLGPEDLLAADRDLARKCLAHLDDRELAPTIRVRRLSSVHGSSSAWLLKVSSPRLRCRGRPTHRRRALPCGPLSADQENDDDHRQDQETQKR